ncbi:MAG: hypothetical protein ACK56F_06695, partial [bacterium]
MNLKASRAATESLWHCHGATPPRRPRAHGPVLFKAYCRFLLQFQARAAEATAGLKLTLHLLH